MNMSMLDPRRGGVSTRHEKCIDDEIVPSGRLALEVVNIGDMRWVDEKVVRRWRDTRSKSLENRLSDALMALESMAVRAKELRLNREERDRNAAEERALRERRRKRRHDAEQLEKMLRELATSVGEIQRLRGILAYFETKGEGGEFVGRIRGEVVAYIDMLRSRLTPDQLRRKLEENGVELDEHAPLTLALFGTQRAVLVGDR